MWIQSGATRSRFSTDQLWSLLRTSELNPPGFRHRQNLKMIQNLHAESVINIKMRIDIILIATDSIEVFLSMNCIFTVLATAVLLAESSYPSVFVQANLYLCAYRCWPTKIQSSCGQLGRDLGDIWGSYAGSGKNHHWHQQQAVLNVEPLWFCFGEFHKKPLTADSLPSRSERLRHDQCTRHRILRNAGSGADDRSLMWRGVELQTPGVSRRGW